MPNLEEVWYAISLVQDVEALSNEFECIPLSCLGKLTGTAASPTQVIK